MKIFVTGATGVLGKRVVKLLMDKNHAVVALCRSSKNADALLKTGAEIRRADLFDADVLAEATNGCDVILHLATSIPQKKMPRLSDWKMNDKIRIEGTKCLAKAAITNNINTFICEGITAVYGQQHGDLVSENTAIPKQQVAMVESAVAMEKIIREQLYDNYVIVRFGHFYAADAFHTRNLIDDVSKGKMPMIGKGDFYSNFIHVDDAADSILFVLENFQQLKGRAVNVTDFHPILFADLLRKLSSITESKIRLTLPLFLVRLLFGKNAFEYLTNSYRISKEALLEKWEPRHKDVIEGFRDIISQRIERV